MRTYTHPTITMAAGSTVVKFFDDSKSGTVTLSDIILADGIGDVEHGFDINMGELRSPICEFKMRNLDNYVLGTLLETNTLRAAVFVDGELYFYGYVDFDTINTGESDPSADMHFSNVSFSAIDNLAFTQFTKAEDFETNVYTNPTGAHQFVDDVSGARYIYMKALFSEIASRAGLEVALADIVFILQRKYFTASGYPSAYVNFDDICTSEQTFTSSHGPNGFSKRLNNVFDILGELCREFNLFASIVYEDSKYKLCIRERDTSRFVTGLSLIERKKMWGRNVTALTLELDGMPDGYVNAALKSAELLSVHGTSVDIKMHHTNIDDTYAGDNRELIKNGSDWAAAGGAGIGDDWSLVKGTPSIVSGVSGFTGNVQKVVVDGSGGAGIYQNMEFEAGRSYRLRFKYATSGVSTSLKVKENNLGSREIADLTLTGTATSIDLVFTAYDTGGIKWIAANGSSAGSYFLLDDVSVIEEWKSSVLWGVEAVETYQPIAWLREYNDTTARESFSLSVYNNYNVHYFNKRGWLNLKAHGIRGTYSSETKIKHLMPGYNYEMDGSNYHIHSVKRSVVRNESEILMVKI